MSTKNKKKLQKAASIATSAATVLWLSGVSMLLPAMAATYADGTLLKGSASTVWVVNNGLKVEVRSADVFNNSGYDWSAVKTVSDSALNAVSTANLVKVADNPDVYKIEKNFTRKLASIEIFESYNLDWGKISTISQPAKDSFSYAPIYQHGANLYWRNDDGSNRLHLFPTMELFTGNGYNVRDLIVVNDMEYGSFALGENISSTPETPETPVAAGGLTVSLASDTPAASTIPQTATNVSFLKFNLTAGTDAAVTITNMTFKRTGVGDAEDFENMYLYEGATRLTSGRSVNSTSNEINFASLALSIAAGTTKTLTLVADMDDDTASADQGNVNAFQILAGTAIGTTATVGGSFPITGNYMTVGGSSVGTLDVDKGSTPTNPKVGEKQVIVTEFKLNITNEDLSVKRIGLYQAGSISRANLTNFKLYQGSTLLGEVSELTSKDLAIFDLTGSPYALPKNITRIFTVKADIGGNAKPDDTIRFYIDQPSDIYAIGATYGFGVYVDTGQSGGTFDGSSTGTKYTEVTVQGGQITVTTSGPSASDVAKGANDHVFVNFAIAAAANSQIKTMRIEFHAVGADLHSTQTTVSSDYISDVKVIDTDSNVAVTSTVDASSFSNVGTNEGIYYSFTDVIDISAGVTRNFKLSADLSTSISAGQLYVTLGTTGSTVFSATSIKNTDNNQWITDIVPSTAIAGQYQTITSAGLTLTMATTPASQNYIKGASNVPTAGFIFTAGTGADIKVTSLVITGYLSDYDAGPLTENTTGSLYITDFVSSVTLWDGDTQLGTSETFNTSGKATFDGFTLNITKGTSKTLVVKANTSNSANLDTVGTDVGRFAIDIETAADDVTSVNVDTSADVDPTPNEVNSATSAGGIVITLRDSGTLTAAQDAGTPVSALVIAGASELTFAKVKFITTYEEFKITKLQVAIPDSADVDNIATVSVEGGGQAKVSMSMGTGGTANFSDLAIIVPKDGSAIVTLKATLTTITGGADSGDTPQLEITSTNFEAVGTGSSNTKLTTATGLAAAGSSAGGNDMFVKATVPTVALASGWTPASLSNATHTIYKFTVTNNAPAGGYDLALKKVKFDIAVTDSVTGGSDMGPRLNGFKVYRTGESAAITNVTFYDGSATAAANIVGTNVSGLSSTGYSTSVSTQFLMVFDNLSSGEEVIPAGTSKTYEIRATAAGTGIGTSSKDYVQVRVSDPTVTNHTPKVLAYASDTVITLEGTAATFIWSDYAVGASTHTSAPGVTGAATNRDWTDGYYIQTIATDYATLTQ